MNERQNSLLQYVTQHGKSEVGILAEYLNTSKVTVRKDLEYLSERGFLRRERGYALPVDSGDINYRMAFFYNAKRRIAQMAATQVQDGEMVIVESGSTCALFAEELARSKKDITLITNSMYISSFVKDYPNVEVILLGGTLQSKSQTLVGPLTKHAVSTFHVDKAFVGTDGYSKDFGFTGDDLMRADVLSTMITCARHTYVLTDSGKFSHPGSVSFLGLNDVYAVITDSGIPRSEYDYLTEQGIAVMIS